MWSALAVVVVLMVVGGLAAQGRPSAGDHDHESVRFVLGPELALGERDGAGQPLLRGAT